MKRPYFYTVICLVAVALMACASEGNYTNLLQSWVGHNSDELVDVWGGPDSIYQKEDGSKLLTFNRSQVTISPVYNGMYGSNGRFGMGMGMPFSETTERRCRTTFYVDKAKKITRYHYDGDYCLANEKLMTKQDALRLKTNPPPRNDFPPKVF